ncbi:MAG TPA: hypothetical protein PL033_01945 [Candidatus Brocadiia bacterium]|nr:hypothetical protein [Candidatus Brocadiia bacterium]
MTAGGHLRAFLGGVGGRKLYDEGPAATGKAVSEPSTPRLLISLFFTAFGFALLSLCFFRALSLSFNSTVYFLFYLAVGMPAGGWWAHKRKGSALETFAMATTAMSFCAFAMPFLGWLASHSPDMFSAYGMGNRSLIVKLCVFIGYQTLVTFPFFALWGAAEFSGYKTALGNKTLRGGFYLIFVWALVCSLVVGQWSIPALGWLRTVALVPMAVVISLCALRKPVSVFGQRFGIVAQSLAAAALFVVAGLFEQPFQALLLPEGRSRPGDALAGRHFLFGNEILPRPRARLVHSQWGRFCHFTAIQVNQQVVGYYDGVALWSTSGIPALCREAFDHLLFSMVPPGSSICIIGSGGGKQVTLALETNPKRVVAIEVVPEVVEFFKGKGAWANGGVYLDPRVETATMDGRRYMAASRERFDLIVLPYTESTVAACKSFFEPGFGLHTFESFRMFRNHLNPGGRLVMVKSCDKDERLAMLYARTLTLAGFQVEAWYQPIRTGPPGVHADNFILLASAGQPGFGLSSLSVQALEAQGFRNLGSFTASASGPIVQDNSPWIDGVAGSFIDRHGLRLCLGIVGAIGILCCAAMVARAVRQAGDAQARLEGAGIVVAGFAVGVNCICLENGVILWLLPRLNNPLGAFFIGSAGFLFIWGVSGIGIARWLAISSAGILGAFYILAFKPEWNSSASFACLSALTLGSGVFFPLLAIRYNKRLLDLFIADALGGMVGGLAAIWLPMLYGTGGFFEMLPLVWLITFGAVVLTVLAGTGRAIVSIRGQ